MGRAKLAICKISHRKNCLVTYSKRKDGLLKKARELSTLCDVDLALLMRSPTGKVTEFCGNGENIEDVLGRFARVPPDERTVVAGERTFTYTDAEPLYELEAALDEELAVPGAMVSYTQLSEGNPLLQLQA